MFINKVTLYTHVLNEMKEFYLNNLGFNVRTDYENGFEFEVGDSVLEIKQGRSQEKPYYHFAFNIPTNMFNGAKEWAKSRVKLTEEDNEDEIYFDYPTNAHSFYFLDPSENIVEFIARHSVSPSNKHESFSAKEVLNISEINITTDDVISVGNQLIDFGIPARDEETLQDDKLNFMGESEDGAFLLLGPENRRWIFSDKNARIYPLSIQIDKQKNIRVDEKGNINIEKT